MIWLLILIPIVAVAVALMFLPKRKIAWWEYLSLFGVTLLTILISKFAIEKSMTSDTEYWNEIAVEVVYEGKWDEYIQKTCSSTCCCDKDGNNCTTTYYDCSYVDHHRARWMIRSKNTTIGISQSQYNRIKNKWGNEKKTGTHSRAYTYDDGIYGSFWLSRRELIECMVIKHSYENRVQAAHTVFDFEEVKEEDVVKYGLYEYPEIYDNYKQNHILGSGDATQKYAENRMRILNAELGPKKQLKAFILIFKNKTAQSGIMQEAYWKGGNKNEFVLAVGVDDDNKIQWNHPFSWAEKSIVKVETREYINNQEYLNLSNISKFLYKELDEKFVRKQFSEFSYITVQPSSKSIIIVMIIIIIFNIGMLIWFVKNEFDDDLMNRRPKNKTRRDRYKF